MKIIKVIMILLIIVFCLFSCKRNFKAELINVIMHRNWGIGYVWMVVESENNAYQEGEIFTEYSYVRDFHFMEHEVKFIGTVVSVGENGCGCDLYTFLW